MICSANMKGWLQGIIVNACIQTAGVSATTPISTALSVPTMLCGFFHCQEQNKCEAVRIGKSAQMVAFAVFSNVSKSN